MGRSVLYAKDTSESSALSKGRFRRNYRLGPQRPDAEILRVALSCQRFAVWLGKGARHGLELATNAWFESTETAWSTESGAGSRPADTTLSGHRWFQANKV